MKGELDDKRAGMQWKNNGNAQTAAVMFHSFVHIKVSDFFVCVGGK